MPKAPSWFEPYVRYIPTVALVWGIIWDSLTLSRPDRIFDNLVVLAYLTLSAGIIVLLNMEHKRRSIEPLLLLGVLQFSFGNLTSALLILYTKSGTIIGGALFLGLLALLLVSNEVLRERYQRLQVHIAVWYLLVLAYAVLIVPVLVGSIEWYMFFMSLGVALGAAIGLLSVVHAVSPTTVWNRVRNVGPSITAVSIAVIGLYAFNWIPPVPLALKHVGVYHAVTRTAEGYELTYEAPSRLAFWRSTSATYNHQGQPAFCVSAIFAPKNLSLTIYHRWEKWSEEREDWDTVSLIPFSMNGGRDEGYRGYSETNRLTPGLWRCDVETERGALIGRVKFFVQEGTPTELFTRAL